MIRRERNTNIECFRFVLMVAILVWHILVHGYGFMYPYVVNGESVTVNTLIASLLATLLVPATYCFVFISGYYDDEGRKPTVVVNMWLCCLLTSLFIAIVSIISGKEILTLRYLSTTLRPITTYRWWFMSYFLIITILSPLLCRGVKCLHKKNFRFLLLFLLIFNWAQIFCFEPMKGLDFIGLLTTWLLARYAKQYDVCINKKMSILLFICCWFSLFSLFFFTYGKVDYLKSYAFLSYNTPVVMIMAASLFFFVKNLTPIYNHKINILLKPTLFIYLITEGIGRDLYCYLQRYIDKNLFGGGLIVLSIPFICVIIGHFLLFVANYCTTKTSKLLKI